MVDQPSYVTDVARTAIQNYLHRYEPLMPLLVGPSMTEDDAIRWLVDEGLLAGKRMVKTHHKEDIVRFIILAQCLDTHGYTMIWIKHKGAVGARRKDAQHGNTTTDGKLVEPG